MITLAPLTAETLGKTPEEYFRARDISSFKDENGTEWETIKIMTIPNFTEQPTPYHFMSDLKERMKNYGVSSTLNQRLIDKSLRESKITTSLKFRVSGDPRDYVLQFEGPHLFLYRTR